MTPANPPAAEPTRHLTLQREDGTSLAVELRALKVREYPAAFRAWEAEQEWMLVSYCTVEQAPPLKTDWPLDLVPASYEEAVAVTTELNPGFFASCGRRLGARGLRESVGRLMMEAGQASTPGRNPSRPSPPRPG